MPAPDTLHIEMMLGNALLDTDSGIILDTYGSTILGLDLGWVDVSDDVLTETPTMIFQGQKNPDLKDRVADTGTIKLVLNNNATNSGGVVGYYSRDNSNKREGFGVGVLVRVGITTASVTEWFSEGRIIEIKPVAGLLENKLVDVICEDWLGLAARTPMPRIPVQTGVTDDQIIQTIVDALEQAPNETLLDVGAYTYDYALTDVEDEKTKVLTVLQNVAQCGLGRIYITGGATSGEVLKYVDLYSLLSVVEPVAAFDNSFTATEASQRANTRLRSATAIAYPMAKDSSPVVLYTLAAPITIAAGAAFEFIGYFRDPNASSSRTVAAVNVVAPVADTDYKFSSVSGSGNDLNANIVPSAWEVGARSFRVAGTNTSASTGFLWQFQVRGEGLYPYDTISYPAVDTSIRESEGTALNYELYYQDDYLIAKEVATSLLSWYSVEASNMPYIEFVPTATSANYQKMLDCKPGEVVSVTESVTGISYNFLVVGRELSIWHGGKYITERLFIIPVLQVESGLYFTLDTLGQDDLDGADTILAFG